LDFVELPETALRFCKALLFGALWWFTNRRVETLGLCGGLQRIDVVSGRIVSLV